MVCTKLFRSVSATCNTHTTSATRVINYPSHHTTRHGIWCDSQHLHVCYASMQTECMLVDVDMRIIYCDL